jgi:thymidylate synthase
MKQYHDLLEHLLVEGDRQFNERTGHLMIGKGGHQSVYDLREGFPATTTKPLFLDGSRRKQRPLSN